ncbi:MAG: acyl-CoA reductase [Ginsengibacter sp.]
MNLEERIELMARLADYITKGEEELDGIKIKAFEKNKWFTEEFINLSLKNICKEYLDKEKLQKWVGHYRLDDNVIPQKIGIVMAGNIPLVGFHDFLTVFISGHIQRIKLSDKDDILLSHLIKKLTEWESEIAQTVQVFENLKDCDAYIATGSNNSSRYFNFYFGRYPSVIRSNKTSVGLLSGNEDHESLARLSDDVHSYFGLGCRNVTKIWVPENYNFIPLLDAFKKYSRFSDHTKYRNNYDYNLALLILNNKYYMTNDSILLVESENVFSPVSELNYSFYKNQNAVQEEITGMENVQCAVGEGYVPFGESQRPGLFDYADGIDTMKFLLGI